VMMRENEKKKELTFFLLSFLLELFSLFPLSLSPRLSVRLSGWQEQPKAANVDGKKKRFS